MFFQLIHQALESSNFYVGQISIPSNQNYSCDQKSSRYRMIFAQIDIKCVQR